uniref:Uncharacterized protein n=1 Tax=Cryptomonas curvata TaxID=233186 RepID=A0A7S0MJK1_9CRYP|mmetsp:Transcript_44471/g.93021  ORF Transcript_44471/g.93021 Transcript_44471/m.93021 type:complete len:260 (+) Transcript_44471:384-1163(+)
MSTMEWKKNTSRLNAQQSRNVLQNTTDEYSNNRNKLILKVRCKIGKTRLQLFKILCAKAKLKLDLNTWKSDQAIEANEKMSLDAEGVYPVVNLDGKVSRYYPATISNQLQLSCEALNAVLASYGVTGSSCWYKCQLRLSALLGTYPRVSSRFKAGQLDCQAPCGPNCQCEDLASPLDLEKSYTVAYQNNREMPMVAPRLSESEALPAAMEPSDAAPLTSRLAVDGGGNAPEPNDSVSVVGASNLELDARRKICRIMRGE